MRTLITNAIIVNEGREAMGSVLIDGERIVSVVVSHEEPAPSADNVIDANGSYLLPGIIDSHVHFREPGLTHKADIWHESRAAAAGGVTTFFDMPNTVPQTTTLEALEEKMALGSKASMVNHAFFFGATNSNARLFKQLPKERIPGIKLFMGSSTGDMLVDRREALDEVFSFTELPIVAHLEDTSIINRNMLEAKRLYGDDPDVRLHSAIRSREACIESTKLALELAKKHGTRLHVAHVSTKDELDMIPSSTDGLGRITAEAVTSHILLDDSFYSLFGSMMKVNPSVKTIDDRIEIVGALNDGRIATIATDHAPHLKTEKLGGAARAASGMPIIQFSLPYLLSWLFTQVPMARMVELMCHNPAKIFGVVDRGFIREGYYADLTMVRMCYPREVHKNFILSKCGWSPLEGCEVCFDVEMTICNGHTVWKHGHIAPEPGGMAVEFRH